MTREDLREARDLIRSGDYAAARDILHRIKHPIADRWLVRLAEIDPPHDEPAPDEPDTIMLPDDDPVPDDDFAFNAVQTIVGALIGAVVSGLTWALLPLLVDEIPSFALVGIGLLVGAMTGGVGGYGGVSVGLVGVLGTLGGTLFGLYGEQVVQRLGTVQSSQPVLLSILDDVLLLSPSSLVQNTDIPWILTACVVAFTMGFRGNKSTQESPAQVEEGEQHGF